ncbi:TonB-dependent receptor plug domain-containing protein [Maribacter aestuarii]|uniref:TonB-dependent receptor plug domain-containing protein n=1 Tax=Maribacter aestuarii TaxID=1130723 RepID=UPI00248B5749|nr:TonB-dependent receptor plug domain-containing protein [Maribacter aestuarii]
MKKVLIFFTVLTLLSSTGCNSSKQTTTSKSNLNRELTETNKGNISLLQRISQKRGIIVRNGVPIINKTANSLSSSATEEPLYVLNSQIIGSSFKSIDAIVDNFVVESIEILSGAEAASYGTQAANGVILIKTYD